MKKFDFLRLACYDNGIRCPNEIKPFYLDVDAWRHDFGSWLIDIGEVRHTLFYF